MRDTPRSVESPRRADARKNIAAIIEAATECLARDPDISVNDIAKAAGVGRVTLYGHFDSRVALVSEVVARAISNTEDTLSQVDLDGAADDVLGRLLEVTWQLTYRYGAVVAAAEKTLTSSELTDAHEAPVRRVERVLRRGRRDGVFRRDVPLAWQVTIIQGILHAAVEAVRSGDVAERQAPGLVRDAVLAALAKN